MKISEMNDLKLRQEYEGMDETINIIGCYGTRDLMYMHALEKEIYRRGGEIQRRAEVWIPEKD